MLCSLKRWSKVSNHPVLALLYISMKISWNRAVGTSALSPNRVNIVHVQYTVRTNTHVLSLLVTSLCVACSSAPSPLLILHTFICLCVSGGRGSCERIVKEPDMLNAGEEDMNRGATGRQPRHKWHSWCCDCSVLLYIRLWMPFRPLRLPQKEKCWLTAVMDEWFYSDVL